jgi:choline dehydrogenase
VTGGTEHDWGYLAGRASGPSAPDAFASERILALRGKVVGGSSAVNGTSILRALPSDFDRWVAEGNPAWAWDHVLPEFCRLEDDPAPGPWHGQGGPLAVRRFEPDEMRPVHRAFLAASTALGYPLIPDLNAPGAIGAGSLPVNQVESVRQSAALTHLSRARDRPNLTVRSGATVDRLEIVDRAPRTVVLATGERLQASRVVLAAGAYGSPAILMRSGVGLADELQALAIEPAAEMPAVGRHLTDHPVFVVSAPGDLEQMGDLVPPIQSILSFTSDGSTDQSHVDLQIVPMVTTEHTSEWFDAPPGTLLFGIALGKPRSKGHMRIVSADPTAAPEIWLNFFEDRIDVDRIVHGVDVVRSLLATPELEQFVGPEQFPGPDATGARLERVIRTTAVSGAHASGTCRMGPDPATSVVDQTGRVHGLDDLWVIDASIIPSLPTVPTNATTMMLAERCVAWMRGTQPLPKATS